MRTLIHLALSASLLAGCSAARKTDARFPAASTKNERPLRLAFITCCKDGPFYGPVKKGMHDAAAQMSVKCDWLGTEDVNVRAQAGLVRQAVADGYDGIALSIIDPEAFDSVVAEAIKQGVPVVGFNVDDSSTPNARLSSVNQRFKEAGQALVNHVAAEIPPGAHILATLHDKGISALDDRLAGLRDALKNKDVDWTILVTGNDTAKGETLIADAFRQDPELRIVFNTGLADTEAAGRVIERHFAQRGCWSAGFDLSPEILRLIQAGPIRCTVDQQPYIQGFFPVIQLTLYLRYGLRPSDIDAGATIVDRSKVEQVMQLTKSQYR
jgi:simple sugar transport system substrate-binding protein